MTLLAVTLAVAGVTSSCGAGEATEAEKPAAGGASHVGGPWCDAVRKLGGWIGNDAGDAKRSVDSAVEGALHALTATQQGLYELSSTAPEGIAEDAKAVEQYWYGLDSQDREPPSPDLVSTFVRADTHHRNLERWVQDTCATRLFHVSTGSDAAGQPPASADEGAWRPEAVDLVDSEGYTYTFSIQAAVAEPGESDITDAPPGETDFVRPSIEAGVAQTNTTPGRAEDGVHVELMAFWLVPVDACAALNEDAIKSPDHHDEVYCPIASSRTERPDHLEFDDVGAGMTAQYTTLDRDGELAINRGFQVRRISEEAGALLAKATQRPPDAWLAVPEVDVPEEYVRTWPAVTDRIDTMGSLLTSVSYTVLASDGLPAPCGQDC